MATSASKLRAKTPPSTSSSRVTPPLSRSTVATGDGPAANQLNKLSDAKSGKVEARTGKAANKTAPARKRLDPAAEKARKAKEELALREQILDLQNKLREKEDAIKFAENSVGQKESVTAVLDELKCKLTEKDSWIKATDSDLHDVKVMLADKQAALEKLEWEAKQSNNKVEKLQNDVNSIDVEVSSLMKLFRKFLDTESACHPKESSELSYDLEPIVFEDAVGDIDTEKMELEISTYVAILAAAKENPSEDILATLTEARLRLQAIVL